MVMKRKNNGRRAKHMKETRNPCASADANACVTEELVGRSFVGLVYSFVRKYVIRVKPTPSSKKIIINRKSNAERRAISDIISTACACVGN